MIHGLEQGALPALVNQFVVLGIVDRFWAPVDNLITDVVTLNPTLLQLFVFAVLLSGIYALVAIGLTIIFGVMDIVNFAHGAFIVIGMYAVWVLNSTFGITPLVGVPFAVVVLFVVGVLMQHLTVKPIIEAPQHNQFIVTFGVLLILESATEITFGPNPRSIDIQLGQFQVFGAFIPYGQLITFGLAFLAGVLLWLFLFRTKTGRAVRGTADSRDGARYVGIDISRIDLITFGLGAALAGLAGASLVLYRNFDPYAGNQYLINAFVIVVLGGLGSLPGAFLGAVVIAFIEVFGGFYMPGTSYRTLVFVVFIAVLVFQPQGIMGEGGN